MSLSRRVLVTGGVRSGKSRYAEGLLAAEPQVTYLAPGRPADPASDPEWATRVADHQARRPASWVTVETVELAAALRDTDGPVLLDCLGTWLAATVDGMGTWDTPLREWRDDFGARLAALVESWRSRTALSVAVTNEVGWGLVSEHRSGRVFTDLLGRTNAEVAAASDDLVLVVAGRALHL